MSRNRPPKAADTVIRSTPNKTGVHLHRHKPEVIREGGLHSIAHTGKVYGIKPIADNGAQPPLQGQHTHRHCAASMPNGYTCPELSSPPARLNAPRTELLPSRMNNRLHYRDGRVVEIQP